MPRYRKKKQQQSASQPTNRHTHGMLQNVIDRFMFIRMGNNNNNKIQV